MGINRTWVALRCPVYSEAVTISPTTLTAIGHSGYSRPFSQVKTISEQPPRPDVIKPRSAAATGGGVTAATMPKEAVIKTNLLKTTRMVAPELEIEVKRAKIPHKVK